MKVVTAQEMQQIDLQSIQKFGIPDQVLMAWAGRSAADLLQQEFPTLKKIAIFCGSGNNGGDGFVMAYCLNNFGYQVDLFLSSPKNKIKNPSKIFLNLCFHSKIKITVLKKGNLNKISLSSYELIVDALLGTGFQGKVKEPLANLIKYINKSKKPILAIDLPSGLPANGESPKGEVIQANTTITIGLPKISLVTYPGKQFVGKLLIANIGFPAELTNSSLLKTELINKKFIQKHFSLSQNEDIHKGDRGHLLIIGGWPAMEGAALMTAAAALEIGVGLITLLTHPQSRQIIAGKIPELMTKEINLEKDIDSQLKKIFTEKKYQALVIGPGLGRDQKAQEVFKATLDNIKHSSIKKVLIDADGLFFLATHKFSKKLFKDIHFIVSPHFQEAARLLKKPIDFIKNNRLQAAKKIALSYQATAILKGPSTIISNGEENLINTTGDKALATAGSGDILSGIIGACLLKMIPPFQATALGVYTHGRAADLYCQEKKNDTLKATNLLLYLKI